MASLFVAAPELKLICPACGLDAGCLVAPLACSKCGFRMEISNAILRAIPRERAQHFAQFQREYAAVRHGEGRGSGDSAYYLNLPFADTTGRNSNQWKMRAATYRYFSSHILPDTPLDILDLGAGAGWLSYRLAAWGHRPAAIDIFDDALDGLGAAWRYAERLAQPFPAIQAEFDALPLASGQFDMAVFNASFHYSTDYARTLCEVRRCLRPSGRIVILDSPVYRRAEHGERMREERHQQFQRQYGFRSDSIGSIEYLDEPALEALARELGIHWRIHRPWYGWKWHMRPWSARLRRRRPPSRFWILEGSFQ
ncbi:MAG TPA: class I SAM-dependent methyltransferase [Bryobacteraceae bacterium]|nr:class I SAM-dependent methyltransferase [Bryobacteraceae bacterium]